MGLGPGPLHEAGKGGGTNVTTGTRSRRINIYVTEDGTIIGFWGASRGLQGSVGGRKRGLLQVGWGRRLSKLQAGARHRRGLAAATSALGPVRICTRKSCRPGSPTRSLPPPPPSARALPAPLAGRHAFALPTLAGPHAATPDSLKVPHPESEVSASVPGEKG